MQTKTKKSVRLSPNIIPTNYNLHLHPDIPSGTFSGKENIKIKIEKETKTITLHSKDLDIETVKYITGKKEHFAEKITYDTEMETTTFHFKNKILKGKGELSVIFSGIISDSLRGFYKSKYKVDGQEKVLATTQFEATDARRAFPCFDEPAQKAIFEISLVVPNGHTAISNTLPINIKEHDSEYQVISFAPSPKMSTYLLAFIIGEFEYVEGYTKDKVYVRVFTTPGKKHQAKFALDVAIKSVEFFNEYFDIPYPLPTLDLIAIPDFESGAMENWGAVTFRETAILVDDEHSSLSNKQWVALVIAHELAHQWFGNLVTMHWWTDLWLNEGFASYIEYLAIDKIFPEWNIWNQFLNMDHNVALALDGLSTSHPIEIKVHHPNEINEIFDKISYSKGASIIRMLSIFIGEEKFRDGLRYYLKKHSYKNTETINLWDAFQKVSHKPIGKIMATWTKQTGYPLITIDEKSKISQERFFLSRVYRSKNKNKQLWQIPLSLNEKEVLLDKKTINIKDEIVGKINNNESSFVRVRYSKNNLESIKEKITLSQMPLADRLGIVRDIFALAEGGYIKTSEAMEFSLCFKNETEYSVWLEITNGINKISNLLDDKDDKEMFGKFVRSLFSPIAERLGFEKKENERNDDIFLRNLAISILTSNKDEKCIKMAKKIFNERNEKPIDADIRGVIYNSIAKNGSIKEWNTLKEMYLKSNIQEERDRLSRAMTTFKDEELIKKTLSFVMENKEVRDQDVPSLLAMTWSNKKGRAMSWMFIKENWKTILKKYGEGGHFLSRLLTPLGNHTTIKDLKDAQKFFSKNTAPGAERTLLQAYERIESNAAWLKEDKKDIESWLSKNY